MRPRVHTVFCVLLLMTCPLQLMATAQVYLTKEEALKLAFPTATSIERRTAFLSADQVKQIQDLGRAKVESKVITYYVGKGTEGVEGYVFFETQIVRTMPAVFMVVINPDTTVEQVEVLAFYEPEDYRPSKKWLSLFERKRLTDDLWLKRGIHSISGATLSAQAITQAVRRLLSTFQVAIPKENQK